MTHVVSALTWFDQTNPNEPIAPITLDFTTDLTWQFPSLQGAYHELPIVPRGINVDNSNNQFPLQVIVGPVQTEVQPFTNANIDFPSSASSCTITSPSAAQVPASFYIKPPSGTGIN